MNKLSNQHQSLVELAPNFFWIKAPGNGRFPFCNGFLLTGPETMLIDAGIGRELIGEIDQLKKIDILLISHSHVDHMMCWDALSDRQILMPKETPDSITDLSALGIRFTQTEENAYYWQERITRDFKFRPMRLPDGRFSNADVLEVGDLRLQAIHAPGHLSDHYCFLEQKNGILLTTDIDFTSFGPWYGNPESSMEQFKANIDLVRNLPHQIACSSHKEPIKSDFSQQAFDVYLAIFDRNEKLIFDLCQRPKSLDELVEVSPFYRNKMFPRKLQNIFERNMIANTLKEMTKKGSIAERGGRFSRVS